MRFLTLEQLEQFVKVVDGLPLGKKMIVHCEGGTGRKRLWPWRLNA
jgi:protein-tyrosine phosphatase